MTGMDQELKKFDTTKMSVEELKMCEDAMRPAAGRASVGGTLHHAGGVSLSKAGRYPVVLAGVAVLTGIGTAMYYKSTLNVQEIVSEETNQALNSIKIPASATGSADAPCC